jgi:drug/metabolite transporter (DMT)-like permease
MLFFRRDEKEGKSAIVSTTLGNLLAALVTLPFSFHHFQGLSLLGAGVLLYLGIFQLGFAYVLFARGVRKVPAAEASVISMLEPVLNPIWVFIGTGERPGPWALVGGAIVVGSVLLRTLAPAQKPEAA